MKLSLSFQSQQQYQMMLNPIELKEREIADIRLLLNKLNEKLEKKAREVCEQRRERTS